MYRALLKESLLFYRVVLRCVSSRTKTLEHVGALECRLLQCVAMCCRVSQCFFFSVLLQYVAACCCSVSNEHVGAPERHLLQCVVAVFCCSNVAACCCSVSHERVGALECRLLQCVAVCCSVLL